MSGEVVIDVVVALCFLLGSLLALVAGIGMVRFPDLLARMHAATKPQVLGLSLMMIGLALSLRSATVVGTLFLVVLFQLITGPVAAHMVGRSGYRTGRIRADLLVRDELTIDLEVAERRLAEKAGREVGQETSKPRPPGAPD